MSRQSNNSFLRTEVREPIRCRLRNADQRGAALFGVILLTALILSLGIFGARTSQIEVAIAGNDLQAKRALEIAEAGVSHAFNLIEQTPLGGLNAAADGFDDELSYGGTGGAIISIGSTTTIDGDTYRFRHFGGAAAADGYYVRAIDNDDETNGLNDTSVDLDGRIHLISRGRAGRAQRVVEAIIEHDPPFPCVLCGAQNIVGLPNDVILQGALTTDSFNSDVAPYAVGGTSGNIQSNGNISLTGPVLLPVNIHGSVTASGAVVSAGDVTTGGVVQNAPPVTYAPMAPCGPPYPTNPGISGGTYDQALGTLVNVGLTLTLAPGTYCFSSITMAPGSTLRVTGPTRIFLTAATTISGAVNTTNVASNLRIYSSVTPPGLPAALSINGGVSAAMAIYAPNAVVDLAGITDFYGAIVAAALQNVGITNLHYDQALLNPPVAMVGWRELRNYVPD